MNYSAVYAPGEKTHRDENFPVASYVIDKKYRGAVLAFYRFARAADDVADHPGLSEQEKIRQLDQFEATLVGKTDAVAEALPLREELDQRGLTSRHALELLIAFRQDARKQRYANWDELMEYCRYSASPVGRFVLDVHGEDHATWAASDNLCNALQIINHLQDCKADYTRLNRIYIPQNALARHHVSETLIAAPAASPTLRAVITELAAQTQMLIAMPLSPQVRNTRLRLEVRAIESIAHQLLRMLAVRDPLSERVHLAPWQFAFIIARAVLGL